MSADATPFYLGQRVRYRGTSGVARVTRWSGAGATTRVWVRYRPNEAERVYWVGELEPVR